MINTVTGGNVRATKPIATVAMQSRMLSVLVGIFTPLSFVLAAMGIVWVIAFLSISWLGVAAGLLMAVCGFTLIYLLYVRGIW